MMIPPCWSEAPSILEAIEISDLGNNFSFMLSSNQVSEKQTIEALDKGF